MPRRSLDSYAARAHSTCHMTDEQIQDLREFLRTSIHNEVRAAVDENVRTIVRDEINSLRSEVTTLRADMNLRFDEASLMQKQTLQVIGERFDDHEQRIKGLESKSTGGSALKLRRA
jgi:hypothetical protein